MLIKAMLRFPFSVEGMTISMKSNDSKCLYGCGEKEPSYTYTVGGNVS